MSGKRRRVAAAALVAAVVAAHLELGGRLLTPQLGDGAADAAPRRFEVAFVQALQPAAPPPPAPPAPVRRPRPLPPASAAPAAASAPTPAPEPAPEPIAMAEAAPLPEPPVSAPAPASAAAEATAVAEAPPSPPSSPSPALVWPPSTRITYRLTGDFRGPVEGQAQVQWLRSGTRYQVHLDLGVGPSFAPLVARSISSEGEITERGLVPSRYDEETRVLLRAPRRLRIDFDGHQIRLPDGRQVLQPEGVQDTASQFVQLTWLFTQYPLLLSTGRRIELPLALPRYVDTWVYEVLERSTLDTPAGPVEAVHVKPRREPRPGVDLTAELWVAPSLQNLPVRILIRQDRETWIDLVVDRLPEQAAPAAPVPAAAPASAPG